MDYYGKIFVQKAVIFVLVVFYVLKSKISQVWPGGYKT